MRQLRDGEPWVVPLRKEEGDRDLTGSVLNECCDCNLVHVTTYTLRGKNLRIKAYRCGKLHENEK